MQHCALWALLTRKIVQKLLANVSSAALVLNVVRRGPNTSQTQHIWSIKKYLRRTLRIRPKHRNSSGNVISSAGKSPQKASGMASNLSHFDLIPTTRSKLLRQMGIGRSIWNDCLRHLPIFWSLFPTGLKQEKDAKFTGGA